MKMNREKLEARLGQLEEALRQSAAQHNMLAGQYQETKMWLENLDKKDVEADENLPVMDNSSDLPEDTQIPNCA